MLKMPGSRVARDVQSRPLSGSSRMVLESTVALIIDVVVWIVGGASLTTTVSETLPTRSVTFTGCSAQTVRVIFFSTTLPNPGTETVISYSPGSRLGAV